MPQVVEIIGSIVMFEVIQKWNIVLEFWRIGLTCDFGEIGCIHHLTWILCQSIAGRNYYLLYNQALLNIKCCSDGCLDSPSNYFCHPFTWCRSDH